jgi:hypothetical protein
MKERWLLKPAMSLEMLLPLWQAKLGKVNNYALERAMGISSDVVRSPRFRSLSLLWPSWFYDEV